MQVPSSVRDEIDRLPQTPLTYACGDFEGAARYALRERGKPFVITFEVALEEVIIDGKDFLYTVFQLWDREGTSHRERVRENLSALFGLATLAWFDRACRETDTMARIGLCDLAVHDLAAIERHYANRTDIAGRHDRLFRSSSDRFFGVRGSGFSGDFGTTPPRLRDTQLYAIFPVRHDHRARSKR